MKKGVEKAYLLFLLFISLLIVFMFMTFRLDMTVQNTGEQYCEITEYEVTSYRDSSAPIGIKQEYVFKLGEVKGDYNSLIFYTSHQNVRMYLDDEYIYGMKAWRRNSFGKSPGYVWNKYIFSPEDTGKTLRVVILPVYKTSIKTQPRFFFGKQYAIVYDVLMNGMPSLILGAIAILMGIIFIVFKFFSYKDSDAERSLLMLGCFSILTGFWKLTDTVAFAFVNTKFPAMSYVPLFALMFMCIPFTMYAKELHSSKESMVWYVPCFISFAEMVIAVFFQITDVMDLREMLWMTHLTIVLIIVISAVMGTKEVRTKGWNFRLKCNLLCMFACFVGATIDISLFYITSTYEVSLASTISFIIYIFVLGFASMQDAKKLIDIGMQAQHFERVAYHDQLTGLNNRSAYVEMISKPDFNPDRCIVVMFDLNDLKKCNDLLGHDKGDIYIKESARIIQECFGDIGTCFRNGGDEFCALLRKSSMEICRQRVDLLHQKVAEYNAKGLDIHMQIACGYEIYDRRIDYDIEETARRADKMMYQDKFAMKQKKNC